MGRGISWHINPWTSRVCMRTRGRVHFLLKFLEDGERSRKDIDRHVYSLRYSSSFIAKALVLGLIRRNKREGRVYYEITGVGRKALKTLEKADPINIVSGTAADSIPGGGYKFISVPVRVNEYWFNYFLERAW